MTAESHQDAARAGKARKRWRRGFIKNRDGATVVEFALLAMPFALLVFAILESCISFAAEEYMQNVTDDTARMMRTGQLKKSDINETTFRKRICDRLEIFVSQGCPGLSIDLRHFNTFKEAADMQTFSKKNADGSYSIYPTGGFKFDPGLSGTKNMLRVYYRWPVLTNLMRTRMSEFKDGTTLHFATATWQNEPFED